MAKIDKLQKEYWDWNKHTKHHKVKYKFAKFLKLKQKSAQKLQAPSDDRKIIKNNAKHAPKIS